LRTSCPHLHCIEKTEFYWKEVSLILIFLIEEIDKAQEAKEKLENIQRNDRKLRAKYHPHK